MLGLFLGDNSKYIFIGIFIFGVIFAGYRYISNKDQQILELSNQISSSQIVINQLNNNISTLNTVQDKLNENIAVQEKEIERVMDRNNSLRELTNDLSKELIDKQKKLDRHDLDKLKKSKNREKVLKIINRSIEKQLEVYK